MHADVGARMDAQLATPGTYGDEFGDVPDQRQAGLQCHESQEMIKAICGWGQRTGGPAITRETHPRSTDWIKTVLPPMPNTTMAKTMEKERKTILLICHPRLNGTRRGGCGMNCGLYMAAAW
jgi:hypothetical protein